MRAGKLTLPAILGLGTLGLLPLAPAQPSDDLVNTPGAMSEGNTDTDQRDYRNNLDIVDDVLKPKLDLLPAGDVHGPADKPYGQRELLLLAPDGNLLAFGHALDKRYTPTGDSRM